MVNDALPGFKRFFPGQFFQGFPLGENCLQESENGVEVPLVGDAAAVPLAVVQVGGIGIGRV